MKNLLSYIPNPSDATSLYRAVGPLQTLRKKFNGGDWIDLKVNIDNVTWAVMRGMDGVFMQRPHRLSHLNLLQLAMENGVKTWVDFDDDLFAVPYHNRTYNMYTNQKVHHIMLDILAKADYVSVSTLALKNKFTSLLKRIETDPNSEEIKHLKLDPEKIIHVPNAYDLELMSDPSIKYEADEKQKTLVVWRGSGTHDKDLYDFQVNLRRVVKNHLDWTYNFVGEPFWLTINHLNSTIPKIKDDNILVTKTLDPIRYFSYLDKIKPAVMIVPLEDSPFNRSKSNIAWLEATHCGALTIAPDWEEWRRPGVINYKNQDDFEKKLEDLIRGGVYDHRKNINKSREHINEHLRLEKVNEKRLMILDKVLR